MHTSKVCMVCTWGLLFLKFGIKKSRLLFNLRSIIYPVKIDFYSTFCWNWVWSRKMDRPVVLRRPSRFRIGEYFRYRSNFVYCKYRLVLFLGRAGRAPVSLAQHSTWLTWLFDILFVLAQRWCGCRRLFDHNVFTYVLLCWFGVVVQLSHVSSWCSHASDNLS